MYNRPAVYSAVEIFEALRLVAFSYFVPVDSVELWEKASSLSFGYLFEKIIVIIYAPLFVLVLCDVKRIIEILITSSVVTGLKKANRTGAKISILPTFQKGRGVLFDSGKNGLPCE